jgi:hypothetical protein
LVVLAKLFSGEPTVRRRTPVRERVGILAACSVFVRARSVSPRARGSKFGARQQQLQIYSNSLYKYHGTISN